MKKTIFQKENKILDLIKKITFEVENAHPSREQMINEIKMMRFKIKPVIGDIFKIVEKEEIFLESLWKIGKIEQIVTRSINKLTDKEKEIFSRYISSSLKQLPSEASENITVLELEVFREGKKNKRNLN